MGKMKPHLEIVVQRTQEQIDKERIDRELASEMAVQLTYTSCRKCKAVPTLEYHANGSMTFRCGCSAST